MILDDVSVLLDLDDAAIPRRQQESCCCILSPYEIGSVRVDTHAEAGAMANRDKKKVARRALHLLVVNDDDEDILLRLLMICMDNPPKHTLKFCSKAVLLDDQDCRVLRIVVVMPGRATIGRTSCCLKNKKLREQFFGRSSEIGL